MFKSTDNSAEEACHEPLTPSARRGAVAAWAHMQGVSPEDQCHCHPPDGLKSSFFGILITLAVFKDNLSRSEEPPTYTSTKIPMILSLRALFVNVAVCLAFSLVVRMFSQPPRYGWELSGRSIGYNIRVIWG